MQGFAIGGLSGGESKSDFCRIVYQSTGLLPHDRPRYLMGVGFPIDLIICVALGCDMFDCVYPTRTARFGQALVDWGLVSLPRHERKRLFVKQEHSLLCFCYYFFLGILLFSNAYYEFHIPYVQFLNVPNAYITSRLFSRGFEG